MSAVEQPATQAGHGPLTRDAAAELVARIRAGLQALDVDVATAYRGGAHVALGYGTGAKGWAALCRDLFADVAWLRPTPAARLERTLALARAGLSQRAAADALGVSAAQVNADMRKLRERGEELPDNVVSLDGRRRASSRPRSVEEQPATPPVPLVLPDGLSELMRLALLAVADAGEDGLTELELERVAGWRQGRCTSLLFRLRDAGLVARDGRKRDGYRVHVATLPDQLTP